MIKAKFGDKVRSKTDTAQVYEALMKVLCHNGRKAITPHLTELKGHGHL